MQRDNSSKKILFNVLFLGLFLEAATGFLVTVFDYWEVTLFSLVLLHVMIGVFLIVPLILYGLVHGVKEMYFMKFFDQRKAENGTHLVKQEKSSVLWGIFLFLFLSIAVVLGGFLTVAGVPRQNEWLLQIHILAGFIGVFLFLLHLRSPLLRWSGKKTFLMTGLLFFF